MRIVTVVGVFELSLLFSPVFSYVTTTTPNRIALVANSTFELTCTANLSNGVRWFRVNGTIPRYIYNGVKLTEEYAFRYKLATQLDSGLTTSTLTFRNVQLTDGGLFFCTDGDIKDMYFDLTVLGSEPICSTNLTNSNTVKNSELFEISCSVNYSGNCAPVMSCDPTIEGESVSHTASEQTTVYRKLITATDDIDGKTFNCRTVVGKNCSNSTDIVPVYEHTWNTSVVLQRNTPYPYTTTTRHPAPDDAAVYGFFIGILTVVVIGLGVTLGVVLCCRRSRGSGELAVADAGVAGSYRKSIRNSRIGNRISAMYSRMRRSKIPPKNVKIHDSNLYDDVEVQPQAPAYDPGQSNYTNAPDDPMDAQSTGDETESQIYAEPPEN